MDTAPEPTGLVEVRTSRVSAGPIRSLASLQKEQRHTQGEGGHVEMGAGPGEPRLQATGPRGLPEPPDAGRGGRGLPRERGPVACMVWTSGPGTVGGGTPGFSLGFRRFVSAALELSRRAAGFRKSGVPVSSPVANPRASQGRTASRGARCGWWPTVGPRTRAEQRGGTPRASQGWRVSRRCAAGPGVTWAPV